MLKYTLGKATFHNHFFLALLTLYIVAPVVAHSSPQAESDATTWSVRPLPDTIGGPESIVLANDGGFVIAGYKDVHDGKCEKEGYCRKDTYIFKLDPAGNKVWEFSYGDRFNDWCNSIIKTSDGGYIAVCRIQLEDPSPDDERTLYIDILVIKLDAAGKLEWKQTYDNGNHFNTSNVIQNTPGGGYIICGASSVSEKSMADAWIFKIDSSGNIQWSKGQVNNGAEVPLHVTVLPDGSFLVVGRTSYFDAGWPGLLGPKMLSLWFLRLGSDGSEIKRKTVTLEKISDVVANSTKDGGIVIAGSYNAKLKHGVHVAQVIRFDSSGAELWRKKATDNDIYVVDAVTALEDGSTAIAGTMTTRPENDPACQTTDISCERYWIAKFDNAGEIVFEKQLGAGISALATAIAPLKGGGFIVAGITQAFARKNEDFEIQIMRLDENGECKHCFY